MDACLEYILKLCEHLASQVHKAGSLLPASLSDSSTLWSDVKQSLATYLASKLSLSTAGVLDLYSYMILMVSCGVCDRS